MKSRKVYLSIILIINFIMALNLPPLVLCHLCCGHEEIHFIGYHNHHLKCQKIKDNHLDYDNHYLNEIYFSHLCFYHELLLTNANNFFAFKEKIDETSFIRIKIEPYKYLQLADGVWFNVWPYLFQLEKIKCNELIIQNLPPLRC